MTARHHVDAVLADDRALDVLASRRPGASADPVLALLGSWAADADSATDRGGARPTACASVTALPVGQERRSRGRRRVAGLATMAALVMGSSGVAAALTVDPLSALAGLRAVIVDVVEAPDGSPGDSSHRRTTPARGGAATSLGAGSLGDAAPGDPSVGGQATDVDRRMVTRPVEADLDPQGRGGRIAPEAGGLTLEPAPGDAAPRSTPPSPGPAGGSPPGANSPGATPGTRPAEPGERAEPAPDRGTQPDPDPASPSVRRVDPGQDGEPGSDEHGRSGDGGAGAQPPPALPAPGAGAPAGGQPDLSGVVQPAPAKAPPSGVVQPAPGKAPPSGVQPPEPPGGGAASTPPPSVPAVVTGSPQAPDVGVDG